MKVSALCLIILFVFCIGCAASAAPTVIDAFYRADVAFPQFQRYWTATPDAEGSNANGPLGAMLHVYVQNTADRVFVLKDVEMAGVSLNKALPFLTKRMYRKYNYPANIQFSTLPKAQIDIVKKAGEPVWWRFEPKSLKKGDIAELVIRLRHKPEEKYVRLRLVSQDGQDTKVSVPIAGVLPRFEAICFSPDGKTAYLYLSHPKAGTAPKSILMDGADIKAQSKVFGDAKAGVASVVCSLDPALKPASLHCFQAIFPDGTKTTATIRAFNDEFAYGMWGSRGKDSTDPNIGRDYVNDLALHNFNMIGEMVGGTPVAEYLKTAEAHSQMDKLGITRMMYEPGKGGTKHPWGFFLTDEPDAGDSKVLEVPAASRLGTLGMGLMQRTQILHEQDPLHPNLLNMDFTYRPHEYYVYGQLPDILASDPYYPSRILQEAQGGKAPEKINAFKTPAYIEGVETLIRSSHAPKPTHIMPLAVAGRGKQEGDKIRYVTSEEKRIEVFYAVGAGAKGISFWWFFGLEPGLVDRDANALAQWREMGLIGAELRTAGPVITTSCPASLPVTAPEKLWARTLVRGNDTVVLICVNNDYYCDLRNINITPLKDVKVSLELPAWLDAKDVFELSSSGTTELGSAASVSGGRADINLGTVAVTRMVFVTSDSTLQGKLQKLYDEKFAANVRKLESAKQ